ncbi:MAG: PKD domain-containing protein [Cyclobacteriaceae bacterium]
MEGGPTSNGQGEGKVITHHMDKSVWVFFAVMIFLSLGTFSYRLYSHEECPPIDFQISSNQHRAGESVKFYDYTPGANRLEWDFGDSTEVSRLKFPIHQYGKEGTYNVNLTVNGRCSEYRTITILKAMSPYDSSMIPHFDRPLTVRVGDEVTFEDKTPYSTSWEWRFGENVGIDATEKNPVYVYSTTGIKTISLVVNGNIKYIAQKKIQVIPREVASAENPRPPRSRQRSREPIYIPDSPEDYNLPKEEVQVEEETLSDLELKAMVLDVSEQRELRPDIMKFFCNGTLERTSVDVNNGTISMATFFSKIEGKTIRIKEIEVYRDPHDKNCIVTFKINYSRKFELF